MVLGLRLAGLSDDPTRAEAVTEREPHPKDCCRDAECSGAHDGNPCWGPLEAVTKEYTETDYWWIHACSGHHDTYEGGAYHPEPKRG